MNNKNEKDQVLLLELSDQKAWVSIAITLIFTILTIRMVQKTRRDALVALESFY
jgi:hypothetical protein